MTMLRLIALLSFLLPTFFLYTQASPRSLPDSLLSSVERRTVPPYFPPYPPSCPICAKSWPSIDSCAEASPVLANFSMIMFNPGAFIPVIKCACADTFQAAFPMCVDCFLQTNQSDVLDHKDLPDLIEGIRRICAIESVLLGGAATADGQVTPSGVAAPKPTITSGAPDMGARVGVVAGSLFFLLGLGSLVL